MKNQFARALKAKKAKQAEKSAVKPGSAAGRLAERAEAIKNRSVLSSTRADKK